LSTSGSTGVPKKISFRRDQMISSARMTEKALNLKPNDSALVCLDTQYVAGQMMLIRSFVTGMNIIGTTPSANPLLEVSKNEKINFAAFVPYQLQAILNSSPDRLNQINVAIIGGAPIDSTLKQELSNGKCKLYATYGMTETISHIALMKLNGENPSPYYSVLPEITIRQDKRNCLVIKADFLDEEIITNDIVELIDNDQFNWIGRWDNVINTGGIKVVPEKIEKAIALAFGQSKLTNRFFVTGINDQQLGQRIRCLL
jgi:O-succinylbenzoic acid--CoA ligase